MKPIATLGVGCFHFAMTLEPPYQFRPANYAEAIESILENLDTVGNFSIVPSMLGSSDELTLTEHALSIVHEGLWPPGYIDTVEFSLRIPPRVQEDIIRTIRGQDYSWIGLGTDHFMVRTRYFYYGPVTIVECLDVDDNEREDPSSAVIVVREYLKHKLGELEKGIQLECVGPSPFHADFYVYDDDDQERPHVKHKERRGYDVIDVYVPPYIAGDRAVWMLKWMGEHLSFYYHLQCIDIRQGTQWEKVNAVWRTVTEAPRSRLWLGRVGASIRKRRAIANLVDGVLMFGATMLTSRQYAYSARKNIQTGEDLQFLDKVVDHTFEETFRAYPTSEVLELAKFYETRDSKWRDRVYVLVAAVIGGAIGAILSQLSWGIEHGSVGM